MSASSDVAHPFLVVREADIPALRAKAAVSPFSNMRTAAINSANSLTFSTSGSIRDRSLRLNNIMSATALAYLLETNATTRAAHLAKIVDHMKYWNPAQTGNLSSHLIDSPDFGSWDEMTAPSAAFYQTVLALDVIYNDLTPAQRTQIEGWLSIPGNFYTQNRINWVTAGLGARGIWALYTNNRSVINSSKADYLAATLDMLTEDGVFSEGPSYALARWWNPDREQKGSFGDVLVHTGELTEAQWYKNPRLVAFQEWLNGYAFTPNRVGWCLGDGFSQTFASWMSNAQHAGRFSALAGSYERRLKQGNNPAGRLTAYIFTEPYSASTSASAPSRIFPDGGAYFRQNTNSIQDLAAVMHNVRYSGKYHAHLHKEVNGIYLAGYGQNLLRGSGYSNWGNGYGGFSWDYINRRAVSGNVALIDYSITRSGGSLQSPSTVNDHRDSEVDRGSSYFGGDGKYGGGVDGFVTGTVDYATGTTRGTRNNNFVMDALPNGNHLRHFLMVQPRDARNGYWISFDVLQANSNYAALSSPLSGHTVWHPFSTSVTTVNARTEYRWPITTTGQQVALSIFLGTEPASTTIQDGALANNLVGKYLFNTYPMDANKRAKVVTVLYPHDNTHPKATFTRIGGGASGYSGATIDSGGGVVDYALETHASSAVAPQPDASVHATAALYRRIGGTLKFYFAQGARRLTVDDRGFESASDISVFLEEDSGKIIAPTPAMVTFFRPGLSAVELNGAPITSHSTTNGAVQVTIPVGTHDIALVDYTEPAVGETLLGNAQPSEAGSLGSPANPFNLLDNPGFETGTSGGWTISSGKGLVDGAGPRPGGFYSARLTAVGSGVYRTIAVQPSTAYLFRTWGLRSLANTNAYPYVSNYNGSAPQLNSPLTTTAWQRVVIPFTSGATTGTVNLGGWLSNGSTGTVAYDDFGLFTAPPAGVSGYEVGLRFTATRPAQVNALRAWCPADGANTFPIRLWGPDGSVIATVTAAANGNDAGGWVEAPLAVPVALTPGETYTVSYPVVAGASYQASGTLPASASSAAIVIEGPVYALASGNFPGPSGVAVNFWADVRFQVGDAAANLAEWRTIHFSESPGNPVLEASVWGNLADPDGDGIANLLEYALGGSPNDSGQHPRPTLVFDGGDQLSLTFFRARADVTYFVEASNGLAGWSIIATNPGSVGETVTVTDTADNDSDQRFLRLRVSSP